MVMSTHDHANTSSGSVEILAWSCVLITIIFYAVLHIVILFYLTNYNVGAWDENMFTREYAYIFVINFILLFVTITSVWGFPHSSHACPS